MVSYGVNDTDRGKSSGCTLEKSALDTAHSFFNNLFDCVNGTTSKTQKKFDFWQTSKVHLRNMYFKKEGHEERICLPFPKNWSITINGIEAAYNKLAAKENSGDVCDALKNVVFDGFVIASPSKEEPKTPVSNDQLLTSNTLHVHSIYIPWKVVVQLSFAPYYCDLNPIELVWAQVKHHVAANHKTLKVLEVKALLLEGLDVVTPEPWANSVKHTIEKQNKMYQLDNIVENMVVEFIITPNANSSTDTPDSDFA
ncbi:hypothetical protein Trydic_g14091 [Trypoxylus dichotomus]